jgi:hypothetical protein
LAPVQHLCKFVKRSIAWKNRARKQAEIATGYNLTPLAHARGSSEKTQLLNISQSTFKRSHQQKKNDFAEPHLESNVVQR